MRLFPTSSRRSSNWNSTSAASAWWLVLVAFSFLACSQAGAQGEESPAASSKTVIGPRNVYLYDGAQALLNQDAERGVALTLKGLDIAQGAREKKIAHSNLCAGYLMLKNTVRALEHCNTVIELDPKYWRAYNNRALVYLEMQRYDESEADIARGQELRPDSTKLKIAKGMLLDETDPVRERIEVDERRSALQDDPDVDD